MTNPLTVREEAERLAAEWLAEIDADLGGYSASVLADRIVTYRARTRREALEEAEARADALAEVVRDVIPKLRSADWDVTAARCADALDAHREKA